MIKKRTWLTLSVLLCTLLCCRTYAVKPSTTSSFDVIVTKRDTLQSIFKRYGLSRRDLYSLLRQVDNQQVESIRPGQLIHFDTTSGKQLSSLKIFKSSDEIVQIKKVNGKFIMHKTSPKKTGLYTERRFILRHSLYSDGVKAGLSAANISEINRVMQTDPSIDAKKLPVGTSVRVILESGAQEQAKKVIGIDVDYRKSHWSVTRFHDKSGNNFYHPDGRSTAVSFLRYPMSSFRISSPFSMSRMHPIHHYRRPHLGVDLAAPRGSPVWSTAQGKVVFVGWKGGYGKTIIIKHGAQYQTVYGHLSRFRTGLKIGDAVKQRQVVGYVGSTGHATGPHLHYEMRRNGVPVDPMRARLPQKSRLGGNLLNAFKQYRVHVAKALSVSTSSS